MKLEAHARYASYDGDADRLIYFTEKEQFVMLDGDKIAALMASMLKELLGQVSVKQTIVAHI